MNRTSLMTGLGMISGHLLVDANAQTFSWISWTLGAIGVILIIGYFQGWWKRV